MNKTPAKYTFSQKWGDDPFTRMGHAQIPSALLKYGARLGVEPAEGYLICHILEHKWTPGDQGPDQNDLALSFGRSVDRVHALLQSLEKKQFVKISYTRGDLGKFNNALYDFRPLRALLNECYYQEHPEERPQGKKPLTMPTLTKPVPQIRGAAKRSRETAETHSADPRSGRPRNRGAGVRRSADSPIESLETEEIKEAFSASLFPEEASPEGIAPAQPAPWAMGQARKELAKPDFKARHGRPSRAEDWTARAWEIMHEKAGEVEKASEAPQEDPAP